MEETEKKERKKPFRLKRKLMGVLALVVLLAVAFGAGAVLSRRSAEPVITSDLIGQQLEAVSELATVEYHYTNMGKFENQVDFYGWKVPFTTKSFIVAYDGVIKAGVDLSEMKIEVSGKTITVTMPEAKVLSHEMDEEGLEVYDETHNIFNPIEIEDYTQFTADQKESIEARALDNGLLTSAAQRAENTVRGLIEALPGMEEYTLTIV